MNSTNCCGGGKIIMNNRRRIWDSMVARYGLHPTPYDQIANWAFVDWMLNFGEATIQSTIKIRQQVSRTAHHPLTGSLHTALREDCVRARQQRAVDEDVELLVVESDHPGDGCDFAQRVVVGPGDVRMHGVALSEGPVGRGDSLVGAYGFGLARLQVRELDVGAVDVKASRQTCFEQQDWAVCLGQYHAVELDPDVAVGAE